MNPVIYIRPEDPDDEETRAASDYFPTFLYRTEIPPQSLVICRYSFLPFAKELEHDLHNLDCELINSLEQHSYVADLRNYVQDLEGLTPKTWTTWHNLPEGAYVVKGVTNSRKFEWNTRMFAPTVKDIPRIANSLLDDVVIKSQGLVVREYVPLKKFGEGINGLPITNEWRFFILDDTILTFGYYWASAPEFCPSSGPPPEAFQHVRQVMERVGNKIRFYVVDVGEKAAGGWIALELNDGCQSGLSMIDPDLFYSLLSDQLADE